MEKRSPKKLGSFKGKKIFDGHRKDIIMFLRAALSKKTFRDDYNELAELSLFLIDDEFLDISFKKPGTEISFFPLPFNNTLIQNFWLLNDLFTDMKP